jgi:hypothetical protein
MHRHELSNCSLHYGMRFTAAALCPPTAGPAHVDTAVAASFSLPDFRDWAKQLQLRWRMQKLCMCCTLAWLSLIMRMVGAGRNGRASA